MLHLLMNSVLLFTFKLDCLGLLLSFHFSILKGNRIITVLRLVYFHEDLPLISITDFAISLLSPFIDHDISVA